eukprot:127159_1
MDNNKRKREEDDLQPPNKKQKFNTIQQCISAQCEADDLLTNLSNLLAANPDFKNCRDDDEDEQVFTNCGDFEDDLFSAIIFLNHQRSIIETKYKYSTSLKAESTISSLILNEDALFQLIADFACDDEHFSDQQFIEILENCYYDELNIWHKCAGDAFSAAIEGEDDFWNVCDELCYDVERIEKKEQFGHILFSNEMIQFMSDNLYDSKEFHFTDTDNYIIYIYLGRTKTTGHLAGYMSWEFTN